MPSGISRTATTPLPSGTAATSTTTISSASTSSLSSDTLSPTPLQQTVHVTRRADPSLALHVRSRASSSNNTPTYDGGDVISGKVVLNLTSKEAPYVTSVEIELQGEIFPQGRRPHRFLIKRSTLWTSIASDNTSTTAPVFAPEKSIGHPRNLIAIPPPSPDQPCRSPNKPYSLLLYTLRSMGIGLEQAVEQPFHKTIRKQISRSRLRLAPSKAHTWSFQFLLPTHISSFVMTRPRTPNSILTTPHTLQHKMLHSDVWGVDDIEESEGKGGVRVESYGNRYRLDDPDEARCFQDRKDTLQQNNKENTAGQSDSIQTPHRIVFEHGAKSTRPAVQRAVVTSKQEQRTYTLPPSFSESACVPYLEYKLVVKVRRRGALRGDKFLMAKLHVPHRSGHNPGLPLRKAHPDVVVSRLPGPLENPDGWNFTPDVVMQMQPTILRSLGTVNYAVTKEIILKLALSRPLCYAGGTTIPFRITIYIPDPDASVSQDSQSLIPVKKCKLTSALASQASLISSSVPSLVGASPLFRKSYSTSRIAAGTLSSHVIARTSSQFSTTAVPESPQQPTVSLVPSKDAIASSIKLVRAIHVGADANDDSKLRRNCASFMHTISTAVILDDVPLGSISPDDKVHETGSDIKGWKSEQGRLVRTFIGEIPLKEDIRPSVVFSHFVLQYAVVLFPFEVSEFTPSSNEPLWSEPIIITTQTAESELAPSASEDQPILDKADREIYTRYFASYNQHEAKDNRKRSFRVDDRTPNTK